MQASTTVALSMRHPPFAISVNTLSLACIGAVEEPATIRSYVAQFRVAVFWTISDSIECRRCASPLPASISQQWDERASLMKQVTFGL